MTLANNLGWLDTDLMLETISNEQFNERYALAILEYQEQAEAWGDTGSGRTAAADDGQDEDAFWRQQCGL